MTAFEHKVYTSAVFLQLLFGALHQPVGEVFLPSYVILEGMSPREGLRDLLMSHNDEINGKVDLVSTSRAKVHENSCGRGPVHLLP
jgi:hypothetical protein